MAAPPATRAQLEAFNETDCLMHIPRHILVPILESLPFIPTY